MRLDDIVTNKSLENVKDLVELLTKEARGEKKEKITFVIGAGFSHTVNIPHGLELRDKLYLEWEALRAEINNLLFKNYKDKFDVSTINDISQNGLNRYELADESTLQNRKNKDQGITFEMLCSTITSGIGAKKELVENFLCKEIGEGKKIPFGYEIIAHLVSNKLIDNVISLNFDTLFEKALNEEITRNNYSLIVSDEEFKKALSDVYKSPLIIKPHGCLDYNGTILFNEEEVREFKDEKERLLAQKLSNSSIIIIGCSCTSSDIQKLFQKIAERDYNRSVYWVMKEEDANSVNNLGKFKSNIKLILTKKDIDGQKDLNDLLHSLSEQINEIANFRWIKLGRHEIRDSFWGKNGLQEKLRNDRENFKETIFNKLLLEVIIFAVKMKKDFTEGELLACPRIMNYVDMLELYNTQEDSGYSPRDVLERLLEYNFIKKEYHFGKTTYILNNELFKELGNYNLTNDGEYIYKEEEGGKIFTWKKGEEMITTFGSIFGFSPGNINVTPNDLKEIYKNIYVRFHSLIDSFDFDLSNKDFEHMVSVSFHDGQILPNKAKANQQMREWLSNAKEVKCVTRNGKWISNDFKKYFTSGLTVKLLMVSDVLENKLAGLPCSPQIDILDEKTKYDIYKKRFSIVKTKNNEKFVLYTLRKGTIGCMLWSNHNKDIEEAEDVFEKLSKEVRNKENRREQRYFCQVPAKIKPLVLDTHNRYIEIPGTVINISNKGLALDVVDDTLSENCNYGMLWGKILRKKPVNIELCRSDNDNPLIRNGVMTWHTSDNSEINVKSTEHEHQEGTRKYQMGFNFDSSEEIKSFVT